MKKDNKTQTIAQLLKSDAFSKAMGKNKLNSIVKHSTIFSFWTNIVGAKFANITKPYAIKGQKLYVSARSPVIIQELSLYKNKILIKLNSYSKPLGIEIDDIIFSYKNFCASTPSTLNGKEDKPVWFKGEELQNIEVSDETKEKIAQNIEKIKFLNKNQKQNLISKIITNEKAKIMQQEYKLKDSNLSE